MSTDGPATTEVFIDFCEGCRGISLTMKSSEHLSYIGDYLNLPSQLVEQHQLAIKELDRIEAEITAHYDAVKPALNSCSICGQKEH